MFTRRLLASAANDAPACAENDIALSAGPDGASYAWTGPGGYTSSQQNPLLSPAVAGSYCVTVMNGDGAVGTIDLLDLLAQWGTCGGTCTGDVNGDGAVDVVDLLELLANWGQCA